MHSCNSWLSFFNELKRKYVSVFLNGKWCHSSKYCSLYFNKFTSVTSFNKSQFNGGWSGGVMVLGKLPGPRRPTIWITVGQGPTALAVGAGGGCFGHFTLLYVFSPISPPL